MKLIEWAKDKYYEWLYIEEHNHGGVIRFWERFIYWVKELKTWWGKKPSIVRCTSCNRKIWHNGKSIRGGEIYCNDYCYQTGPPPGISDDEIPF